MPESLSLAIAQLNPTVGDIPGNTAKLLAAWREAHKRGANILVTTELFLVGYTPEDFALKPSFQKNVKEAIDAIARNTASGPAILLGTLWVENDALYNAALLIEGGKIVGRTFKHLLPNYGPFDECRVFEPGPMPSPLVWNEIRLGVLICEDMWFPQVARELKLQGAEMLISLNASPFHINRHSRRLEIAQDRARETGLSVVYVNQVGGQDELLYQGTSFVLDKGSKIVAQARTWSEDMLVVPFAKTEGQMEPASQLLSAMPDGEDTVYQGLVLSIRDYVTKNNFKSVLLGLSGGIDSALVAALAVDALGAENVHPVMMPSPFTSELSIKDAAALSKTLGCRLDTLPIHEAMTAFDHILFEPFAGCTPDATEENIQARCRGLILMALSNKSGSLVLATGNKSELAVGYTTLYGDTCGGFAPIKDVYKTDVYKLAKWRNENKPPLARGPDGEVFSDSILAKAPSAELRAGQKDQDTLPDYGTLDDILKCLIEQDMGLSEITMMAHDPNMVKRVHVMLDRAEYKRRQCPPGPKVTRSHLTKDRRYPITNAYCDPWKTK